MFSGPQVLIILSPYTMTILKYPVANIQWSPSGLDYSIVTILILYWNFEFKFWIQMWNLNFELEFWI